jgi:prophage regulatory protein
MNRLIRMPEVAHHSGLKKTKIYADIGAGLFTKPVKAGTAALWPISEIEQINKARIAGKSDDQLRALVDKIHAEREVAA